MQTSPERVWEIAQEVVRQKAGIKVTLRLLMVATSPCCKTFSKADSSNVTKGNNYRLHLQSTPTRPPKDKTSKKGRAAVAADEMVKGEIKMARWCRRRKVPMYMENPVGSLWRREYVAE